MKSQLFRSLFHLCVSLLRVFQLQSPPPFFSFSFSLKKSSSLSWNVNWFILWLNLYCVFGHVQQHPPNSSPFFVFISALHPRFDFKFFSRRNGVKLEERICCQTHISHHLVWYFKPSRREAGLRSLRDREGTKLAIDFLFFLSQVSIVEWESVSSKAPCELAELLLSWSFF